MSKLVAGLTIAGVMLAAVTTAGQTDDLKSAHDRFVAQWIAGDVAAIERAVHAEAAGFWADTAAATDFRGLTAQRRQQAVKTLYGEARDLRLTPMNLRYRTYGTAAGVVWGVYKVEFKDKKGAARTENWRTTEVFTREPNGWVLVSWHFSDLPSRK